MEEGKGRKILNLEKFEVFHGGSSTVKEETREKPGVNAPNITLKKGHHNLELEFLRSTEERYLSIQSVF